MVPSTWTPLSDGFKILSVCHLIWCMPIFVLSYDDHMRLPLGNTTRFSHQTDSPHESVAPTADESIRDFVEDCDWTPKRGPQGHFSHPSYVPTSSATASASSASMESTASPLVPSTSEDTKMTDSGVTTASASLVTSQAATT